MSCYDYIKKNNLILKYKRSVSYQFIQMTIDIMNQLGFLICYDETKEEFLLGDKNIKDIQVYNIEPDASTVNFYLAHAALNNHEIIIDNIGNQSIQGDSQMIYFLQKLGYFVKQTESQTILFSSKKENMISNAEIEFNCEIITDSFIALSVIVSQLTNMKIKIKNIENQNKKESKRIDLVAINLNKLGIYSYVEDDLSLVINTNYKKEEHYHDIFIETANDHRIAMAFSILANTLRNTHKIIINNKDCVDKTYPQFYKDFSNLFNYEFECYEKYNMSKSEYNLSYPNQLNSNLLLIGMKSAGKTQLGKYYASAMSMGFIDLDELIYDFIVSKDNNSNYPSYSSNNLTNIINIIGISQFREYEEEVFLRLMFNKSFTGLVNNQDLIDNIRITNTIISCGGGLPCNNKLKFLLKANNFVIYINNNIANCVNNMKSQDISYIYKDNFEDVYNSRTKIYEEVSSFEFKIPIMMNIDYNALNTVFFNFANLKANYDKVKIGNQGSFMLCYILEPEIISNTQLIPLLEDIYELIEIRFDKVLQYLINNGSSFLEIEEILYNISFNIKLINKNSNLLFTIRSIDEGGYFDYSNNEDIYYMIISNTIKHGLYNFIDIEYRPSRKRIIMDTILNKINSRIILSKHYLQNTHISNIKEDFSTMNIMTNIDILKIITSFDSEVTYHNFKIYLNKHSNKPYIYFQLGDNFSYTRLFNHLYTPVYDPKYSIKAAPGQLTKEEILCVRKKLNLFDYLTLDNCISHIKEFYSVLGTNVSKSLSPKLHSGLWKCDEENLFKFVNIQNEEQFRDIIIFSKIRYFSITMPFKEISITNVNYSADTKFMNSCNTIKKIGDQLFGYNTDYVAMYYLIMRSFNDHLKFLNKNLAELKFLIIGIGGASKGVLFALSKANINFNNVYIANRSDCELYCKMNNCNIHIGNTNNYDIVISTVPKNVNTDFFNSLKIDLNSSLLIAFDLAYDTEDSTVFKKYLDSCCDNFVYNDGIEFLNIQGKLQYELFAGKAINVTN